jgi:hypothetical protein
MTVRECAPPQLLCFQYVAESGIMATSYSALFAGLAAWAVGLPANWFGPVTLLMATNRARSFRVHDRLCDPPDAVLADGAAAGAAGVKILRPAIVAQIRRPDL